MHDINEMTDSAQSELLPSGSKGGGLSPTAGLTGSLLRGSQSNQTSQMDEE